MNIMNITNIEKTSATLIDYKNMLQNIQTEYPVLAKATKNFGKTQSQFADNMLTITQITPLRSLRQILAETEKSRKGLESAKFKNAKQCIKIKMLKKDIENETDDLVIELKKLKIKKIESQLDSATLYITGAIRKITNYIEQYNSILEKYDIKDFSEIDFEKEEARYHVMTAFNQAAIAARTRQGIIDEGNHIYFMQIGINGAVAQMEINRYLSLEGKLISEQKMPTHEMYMNWLKEMGNLYSGHSSQYALSKGMTGKITEKATVKNRQINKH